MKKQKKWQLRVSQRTVASQNLYRDEKTISLNKSEENWHTLCIASSFRVQKYTLISFHASISHIFFAESEKKAHFYDLRTIFLDEMANFCTL